MARREIDGKYTVTYRQLVAAAKAIAELREGISLFPSFMTTHRHVQYQQLPRHFSAAELARAHKAELFHRNQGHISDNLLITALDNNCFPDSDITSQDIRNMRAINHAPSAQLSPLLPLP